MEEYRNEKNFFDLLERANNDRDAERELISCLAFAVNYGLKRREAYFSKQETMSNNAAPSIVREMRQNEKEDLTHDVFVYLINRVDNITFREKPANIQLMLAGDSVVRAAYARRVRRAKAGTISLDALREHGVEIPLRDDLTQAEIESLFNAIIAKVPKLHRERARRLLSARYSLQGKEETIAVIAKAESCSTRTVDYILSEIRAAGKPLFA